MKLKEFKEGIKDFFVEIARTVFPLLIVIGVFFIVISYFNTTSSYNPPISIEYNQPLVELTFPYSRISITEKILANEDKIAVFEIKILFKNHSTVYLSPFILTHVKTIVYEGSQEYELNDVLITLPKEFFLIKEAIDKDVEIIRTTVRGTVTRDPTFYRGKDFNETLPFNELAIEIRRILLYNDTKEVFYEVYIRIEENATKYDLDKIEIYSIPFEITKNEK